MIENFKRRILKKEISQDEISPLLEEYQELYTEIDSGIELFRRIIQDTIKKFEELLVILYE